MSYQTNPSKRNNVKGCHPLNGTTSSGRGSDAPQVHPDCQQATALNSKLNLKKKIKIATWNVRIMNARGKPENVKREMERLNVNILGISEMRWKEAGWIPTDKHELIHSGGSIHERGIGLILNKETSKLIKGYWGVSDRVLLVKLKGSRALDINIIQVYAPTSASTEEELDNFYKEVETAKKQCKVQAPIIIMGDLNAKVGCEKISDTLDPYGQRDVNDRGEKLIEWAQINQLVISNTWFKQPLRRRWTWKKPGTGERNQIDYMMISKRFRDSLMIARSAPGADCYSDHIPVTSHLRLKLKKQKRKN